MVTVRPPNEWCGHRMGLFAHRTGGADILTGLFAHRTGGADTERDCSPTEWVVRSPHCDHRTWLFANGTGLFAQRTNDAIIAHDCLPTKPDTEQMVRSPHMAVYQPNRWCGHRARLRCSPTERVVRSPHMAVCSPNGNGG